MQGSSSKASNHAGPYVLVADDDATSLSFLGDALHQLGARTALSPDGRTALALARREAFDLLILDCRMPDLDGASVLAQLRHDLPARSAASPAVASSAELDGEQRRALLAAGFHAVLLKPCTLKDLHALLSLSAAHREQMPWLDDRQALSASGTPAVVQALRGLFYQELVAVERELDDLSQDAGALEARLHKLRSSCGFCGAAALSEHIASLQTQLKLSHQGAMLPLGAFRESLRQTMAALQVA
ncbi:response regulator [Dyella acidiphila]|uniref:Response regulator n=1 Tax=Dyella acidiphila TaxID=2775866 RepID=A0ABR9GAU7_9GAMM|nr:response regulator [Dyella acidiphila]MBE1161161.1 response regulator [Dyella acidiphila]